MARLLNLCLLSACFVVFFFFSLFSLVGWFEIINLAERTRMYILT